MNIFFFTTDTKQCAQWHIDKHCVKMIVEYAQLLSTAHRVIDGSNYTDKTSAGRSIQRWLLPDSRENVLYKASHINHPSGVWVRKSNSNYNWLYSLFCELSNEYNHRYGKKHKTFVELKDYLKDTPNNIPIGEFTDPTPAMDSQYKISDKSSECYIEYYNKAKRGFAKWTNRNKPEWFT